MDKSDFDSLKRGLAQVAVYESGSRAGYSLHKVALPALTVPEEEHFSLEGLRVFTNIPAHNHDVVALSGMVIVFETDSLSRDGLQEGAFYVVENQYPVAGMSWQTWLDMENQDRTSRAQPSSPLKTRRSVVQLIRRQERWWHRLPSGSCDGPIYDWAVGLNFVGRVAGVYRPPAV